MWPLFLGESHSLQSWLSDRAAFVEDDCLRQVAEQVLGRPFINEDAKDFQIIQKDGVVDKYDIAYKGINLGCIEKKFEGLKYVVTFHPHK